MGFALAAEASRRGARVTLVAGPTALEPPPVAAVVRVRSAAEMHAAVMQRAGDADVIVMAAAVADYAPEGVAAGKLTKTEPSLTLRLTRTRDVLAELGAMRSGLGAAGPVLVGFAAETDDVLRRAREKRAAKQVDLIVANDVSMADRGFEADTNEVTLVGAEGDEQVPLQSKGRVAGAILDRVERLVRVRRPAPAGRFGV
jgi:phosphopantothenoylcysteine decarboxylase/phosphopantothenate--cysteine ligase